MMRRHLPSMTYQIVSALLCLCLILSAICLTNSQPVNTNQTGDIQIVRLRRQNGKSLQYLIDLIFSVVDNVPISYYKRKVNQ